MKRYLSHKIVKAASIMSWESRGGNTVSVQIEPGEHRRVPESVFSRGMPSVGDYLVEYEDGYLSWSPKKIFEAGYTEVT